ncbi:MAG: HAMP domain-containing histidine kinase [Anaerolineales bacterium]|nr:HAMP domain-containing histidine kinase [Anaerolineales bacterium]
MTPTTDATSALNALRQEHAAFLRVVAHALRTPLQSLQGFAEMLEPGLPPAQVEHYLSFIKRDTAHLAAVVDDLCLRHELERGALVLFPAAIDVGAILVELAGSFEARLPDCVVGFEYADDLPAAFADPDRLLHILGTLLLNAERCRPSARGPGWLTINARHEPVARQVVFVVDDDGPRVPAEYAAALFEPFPILPAALGRPRHGIGLGLYAAREVARQMGGDVCLSSEMGASGRQFGNAFVARVPAFAGQVGHA